MFTGGPYVRRHKRANLLPRSTSPASAWRNIAANTSRAKSSPWPAQAGNTRSSRTKSRRAGNQLEGGPCHVLTSDLRVKVTATGLYTYPDIVIVCDKPQFEDAVFDTLLNPRTIVEILSDSTEKYDRGDKFAHYRQVPSLQEYVLVSQDRPHVERHVRQPDGSWLPTVFDNPAEAFAFNSVPVTIPLAAIYEGVEFPEQPGQTPTPN